MISAGLYDAMLDAGFNPPSIFKADGDVTRFNVGNRKQNKDGWIVVFLDGKGAVFGDWKTGNKFTWFESSVIAESTETREQQNAANLRAIEERERRYSNAATEARLIYLEATVCEFHPYLTRKAAIACKGLRVSNDDRLIVPVFGKDEKIQSLQYIDNDGNKRFLQDGKMKSGFFIIGELERGKKALIVEGLATGLTCHDATGLPIIVAFNAGNLKAAHDNFKNDVIVVICADNDDGGKGEKSAIECGCDYVMPPTAGDFNDLGVEKTRELLAHLTKRESLFISVGDLMAMDFRTNWLIKGFIEKGGMGMIYGDSGSGKSLFVLDWAFCLATNRNWHGFKVKEESKVLYIAGEGGRGFKMRLTALQQKYNSRITGNLAFSKQSFNFLDEKSALRIIDDVENEIIKPSLIVVDTLNRNIIGDENKADDMGKFFATIEILVKNYNCAILVVHHSGISDKGRSRGSSATPAGMDFVFYISKTNDFETSITCTKMKDADKPPPLKFNITKTELLGDEWYDDDDNKQTTGVYLSYIGIDADKEQKLSDRDELALNALKMAVKGHPKKNHGVIGDCVALDAPVGIIMTDMENFKTYFKITCKGQNWARDFESSLKSLTNRRFAGRDGIYLWLIEE
jgi:phage/plasmid primase-like uncharacterized protein/archaellum biogenesis ATPase FlaH